jgi:polyisoprenyl-teichoic acid--peptidoglycan teichoic acid transferase
MTAAPPATRAGRTYGPVAPPGRRRRSTTPGWAKACVIVGAVLLVLSTGTIVGSRLLLSSATGKLAQQDLLGTTRAQRHVTIKGAKNILLVGIDTRPGWNATGQLTRSDSIMLLHVPPAHDRGYLVSLPRDSYVHIPAYDNGKVPFSGRKDKINAAFAYGSRGLSGAAAQSHGFELLALTVKELSGISPDAGAIIDFQGFKKVVDVLGKVCMYVDEDTTSIHIGRDAAGKQAVPYVTYTDGRIKYKVKGVTPNFYRKGNHCFTPKEALDFVRQRDLLANGDTDYGRQRHQQQFLKAVLKQVVSSGMNSPTKLPGLLSAVGKTMTVDSGGIPLEDWAFAMRGVKPEDLLTIKTNNGTFNSAQIPGVGSVELLDATSLDLLKAVRDDTVERFVLQHPGWVSRS